MKYSVRYMKLREQIKTLPPGTIIVVPAEKMVLVRYHARGCRDIVSRESLDKPGRRNVKLGAFYIKPEAGRK